MAGRGRSLVHVALQTLLLLEALSFAVRAAVAAEHAGNFKNVLYMIVDDLRPQMNSYNQSYMKTPNFDRLAGQSLIFERAYCQVAVCVPSRNSFMSGRRPDVTNVWSGNAHSFRDTGPDWVTMPEHFKQHGFLALGGGKTYHPGSPPNWDEPKSWSQDLPYFPFKSAHCPNGTLRGGNGHNDPVRKGDGPGQVTGSDTWCALDEATYPDSYHFDSQLANHTISLLRYAKSKQQPFFVVAGFRRPHVPWMMPRRFWDMYGGPGAVPAPLHVRRPLNAPDIAYHNQGVFNNTDGVEYLPMPSPLPAVIQQAVRRAYMASVTWTDHNIGLVLDALDADGLANDTLVVLHGDHGYQLGEHDSWHKQTNWELAARVPLMVRAPWKPRSPGRRSYALVELVDMYRTAAELVGTATPEAGVNGTSFAALFDDPGARSRDFAASAGKTDAAFSQYLRCVNNLTAQWADNWCSSKDHRMLMGYSIRTELWRYTAWMAWKRDAPRVDWSATPEHAELYDHSGEPWMENDFDMYENENVAAQHGDVATAMQAQLRAFFGND